MLDIRTFQFAFSEGRAIAGDKDQLGFSGAEGLQGGFVSQCDCGQVVRMCS